MKQILLLIILITAGIQTLFGQSNSAQAVSGSIYINISSGTPKPPFIEIAGIQTLLGQSNSAQAVSGSIYINISSGPPKPPFIEIADINFIDSDGNRMIDAGEDTKIRFEIKNTGMGPGLDLKVELEEVNQVLGLVFKETHIIGNLEAGNNEIVELPIQGDINLQNGNANFTVKVNEANGFGTDPVPIEIQTQAFRSPDIKIVDYQVSSQNSSTLVKKRPFDLQILVQNLGQGQASDVVVTLLKPENTFCISTNEIENVGELKAGEQRIISYNLVANNNYNAEQIPFEFQLQEKFGKYAENKNITLAMNQNVSSKKLKIEGIEQQELEIAIASLGSDVDKNIPSIGRSYPNRVALIIGNEDYSGTLNAEVNVPYAIRDAQVFKEYAANILGIEDRNIFLLKNSTAGIMKREINRVSSLVARMGDNVQLYFYYAGHGYPDEITKTPYLIPVDVNATNLSDAVSLKEVYTNLGSTGAAKVTVFLDACFSGGGRNQGLLAARGVKIAPEEQQCMGNMVVFAAAKGDQVALPYHEEKHGLFTYFLLKKLKETRGEISYKMLYDYLKQQVGIESVRTNKEQDPVVNFSPEVSGQWEQWMF